METPIASAKIGAASDENCRQAGSSAKTGAAHATGSGWRAFVARQAVLAILLGVACVVHLSPLFRLVFGLRWRERSTAERSATR